jgi:hypothetical protein
VASNPLSQVMFARQRRFGDCRRIAGDQNLSIHNDVAAVADGQRLAHVMIGDEDPDVPLLELQNDVLDLAHGNRIHPGERLVEQQKLGVCSQGASDLHPAPLSA